MCCFVFFCCIPRFEFSCVTWTHWLFLKEVLWYLTTQTSIFKPKTFLSRTMDFSRWNNFPSENFGLRFRKYKWQYQFLFGLRPPRSQWRIQDFLEGERQALRRAPTYYLTHCPPTVNHMKMKKFWPKWGWGSYIAPFPRSATFWWCKTQCHLTS